MRIPWLIIPVAGIAFIVGWFLGQGNAERLCGLSLHAHPVQEQQVQDAQVVSSGPIWYLFETQVPTAFIEGTKVAPWDRSDAQQSGILLCGEDGKVYELQDVLAGMLCLVNEVHEQVSVVVKEEGVQ